ncbi:hypothetical protein BS333_00305 [Vibrio azureus]|uniref:DUF2860 domain-containing protein n=1 Tax=Vibrio azureus NBRC 104587 TaxID=1219077 RepID=U3ART7_9VIBR|nr:DUF2860 domain-containing protein [Vibrio azureus]AUI84951.1 hypothetical protein BS333_00305 [Vibrio azureus]GAD75967.1 hypothetical protein VAZ01S_034_00460 [Vibrio azureus NBRC 104587]
MKLTIIALSTAFCIGSVQAQLAKEAGISGNISANAGFTSSQSHFNTKSSNTIHSYNEDADRHSSFIAAPLGMLAYTYGDQLNRQFYMGTTRSDIAIGTLAFQLGYQYQLSDGPILDLSYLPTILKGETWQDPYLLNQARSTTDEGGNAFRFQIKNLLNNNLNLDLAYAVKDVENDQVTDTSLARDADIYHFKADYRIPLSRTSMLKPAFTYVKQNADGKAESFDSYKLDLSWFAFIKRHKLALTAGYKIKDYDAASQIFGKARNDKAWSLFAAYEYSNVFQWQNWSFVSLAGYSDTHSNLSFYAEKQLVVSAGLNYNF